MKVFVPPLLTKNCRATIYIMKRISDPNLVHLSISISDRIRCMMNELDLEGATRSQLLRGAMAEYMDEPPPPIRGRMGYDHIEQMANSSYTVYKDDLAAWKELAKAKGATLSAMLRGALYATVEREHKRVCCER